MTEEATKEASSSGLNKLSAEELRIIQLCFSEHEFGVLTESNESSSYNDAISQNFDPLRFVNDKRESGVSLPTLHYDLRFFSSFIYNKINEHIESEMQTSLSEGSARLVGVQEELQLMERPLTSSIRRIDAAQKTVEDTLKSVSIKVQRAQEEELDIEFDRQYLQGLLYYEKIASALLHDVRPFLAQLSEQSGTNAMNLSLSITEKIEPILLSTVQLESISTLFLPKVAHREKDSHYLKEQCQKCVEALLGIFALVFPTVCHWYVENHEKKEDDVVVRKALNCLILVKGFYSLMKRNAEFCTMFRDQVLRHSFEVIVPWKEVTQTRQSTENTVALLQRIQQLLSVHMVPLLKVIRRNHPDFHPASEILWPSVFELLTKKFVGLYDYGFADAFHVKYTAAYRLLQLCEESCDSLEELEALRASPDVSVWNHKWNVDAYVVLREAEIDKALASSLKTPFELDNTPNASFYFAVFHQLADSLLRLYSKEVYLHVFALRFLRWSATCTFRVLRELRAEMESVLQESTLSQEDVHLALRFIGDTLHFIEFYQTTFKDTAIASMGDVTAAFLKGSDQEGKPVDPLLSVTSFIGEALHRECIEGTRQTLFNRVLKSSDASLQHIKTIRSTFPGMKQTFPSTPSWYVPGVVEPIRSFLNNLKQCETSPQIVSELQSRLCAEVLSHFYDIAKETLLTAKMTEARWEKLRKRKETTGGGEAALAGPVESSRPTPETATDTDKMFVQLYLDVSELLNQFHSLGVGAEFFQTPPVVNLQTLIHRGAWLLGAEGPEPPELTDNL